MNQHLHRLVFSRRHGMLVAVAETASACGKAAGGERRARGTRLLAVAAAAVLGAAAADAQTRPPVVFASRLPALTPATRLPVPNTHAGRAFVYDPAKGNASADLAAAGRVGWSVQGNTGTFNQGSAERVVINWDSFNIGAGYKVHFTQDKDPAKYVSALNRIWSLDPSVILGSLTADREVVLLNANGVYFGRGARVDTGRFVATALNIADSVFEKGLRNVTDGSAVFSTAGTDFQGTNLDSGVSVEAGAEIRSAAGGDVLLIAPRVLNRGRIETPKGQTVLAAGDKVYLMSSSDPAQRGLIVAVDPITLPGSSSNDPTLGSVENAATGSYKVAADGSTVPEGTPDTTSGLVNRINEIRAESGTVNLVGLTVRQNGLINATTAVKGANGAIYLQAMASTLQLLGDESAEGAATRGLTIDAGGRVAVGARLGTVQIGAGSVTAVRPDSSAATQIDAEVFNPSLVRVEGSAIAVAAGAQVLAPAGRIEFFASEDARANPIFTPGIGGVGRADASRIVVAPGANISAAGLAEVAVDGGRNQGALRLFRIELADAPVQRTGPLYRSEVAFDRRDAAKIAIGNVAGAATTVARSASERATAGGSISLRTDGAVVVGEGATIDVSGGSVRYSETTIKNTVLSQDGRLITFRAALAGSPVDSLQPALQQTVAPAYSEGADGGVLQISGRELALAGDISGHVVRGERQRDQRSAAARPAQLSIGQRDGGLYYLDTAALQPGPAPAIDASIFQDPLRSALPGLTGTLDLSLSKVAAGGFGSLVLRAAQVTQPAFGALHLGIGGALDIEAGSVALDGDFTAPGGRLSITTPTAGLDADIRLSASTRLDAAGLWTNDTAGASDGAATAIQTQGGTVSVRSARSLFVAPGATIDVSGGARLDAGGSLSKGSAGAMTLASGTNVLFDPEIALAGVALRGFDFLQGGRLTLGVPELTIATTPAAGFTLAPAFFSASGFGSIGVNAFGDVRIASGIQVAPRLLNWQLSDDYRLAPSGALSAAVATPQLIDTQLASRKPVNVALAATRPLTPAEPGASVVVERGAAIELDPGGALSLRATRDVEIGQSGGQPGQTAELTARGGTIQLAITGNRGSTEDSVGFVGDQAIWLGAGARLSVAGVADLRRDGSAPAFAQFGTGPSSATPADQRRVGTVYGGGSIALDAARGYVIAEAGSALVLDGTAASLNLPGLPNTVQVAKAAGTLTVTTPEGFVLDGSISAQPPRDGAGRALADGGRLNLAVGVSGVLAAELGIPAYPDTPRTVTVGDHEGKLAASGAVRGADLAQSLGNGEGFVRRSMLANAGFDGVQLGAGDLVRFDTALTLNAPLGIQLNTPAIAAAAGVQVSLNSSNAQIGDATSRRGAAPDTGARPDPSPDKDTRLAVTAATIEVQSTLGLQGFSDVSLDTGASRQGEIRFSAYAPNFGRIESLQRQLNFSGALRLTAGQAYATSATQYTLNGDAGSALVVRGAAGGVPTAPPLTAYGSLTVNASDIDQGGVLRQPFGRITLNAERTLKLGDHSLTSVAGAGASVLYGQTINLAEWALPGGDTFFSVASDKAIKLRADHIETSPTALLAAGGGGVLRAWEFFPGVGGSRDYFQTPGLYAVLPDYASTQALALNGGILAAGGGDAAARELVVTMPGSALQPGRYTLLPARYALLGADLPQGAFLVSRSADQGRTTLAAPFAQPDGAVVVSGYLTGAGSVNVGVPGERFTVEPAATYLAKSEIRVTDISTLLKSRAASLGQAQPALPRDGGQLQMRASGSTGSQWQAGIDLAARGAQAGLLDLSATSLALVDDLAKTPDGALGISASVIGNSGAGSVLLGGVRTRSSPSSAQATTGWVLDNAGTQSVTVDLGQTALQTQELLLASSGSVTLAPGTRLTSAPQALTIPSTLTTQGDGALLAVGAHPLQIERSNTALAAGRIGIGAGSVLDAPQVSLDATDTLQVDSSVRLQAQALSVGARRIVVGAGAAPDAQATTLAGELLNTVRSAADLSLRGYSSIDFVGTQNWAGRADATAAQPDPAATAVPTRLLLDAPLVRGLAAADGTPARVDIAAQDIFVRNSTGQAPDASLSGQGDLRLQALPPLRYGHTGGITLGPGELVLAFDTALMRSAGDITLQGRGGTVAQQDLRLSAARVTATSGAQQSLAATGALRIDRESGGRTLGERVGQGADVGLVGDTVALNGVIDLPGSRLTVRADGSDAAGKAIRFGAGSSTSVAGFAVTGADGITVDGAAGSVRASAEQGRIELLGTVDVSAARRLDGSAGLGDAGSIVLRTGSELVLAQARSDGSLAQGRLQGLAGGGPGDLGGRLSVDVGSMASADVLARTAASGGMTREFSLRVRSGDVALDESISSRRIAIAADGGTLTVGSDRAVSLDASAPAGGVVQLAAGSDLVLGDGVRIDTRSQRAGANGGDVLLASTSGRVHVAGGAQVAAGGDDPRDGRIVLRASRGADDSSVHVDSLDTGRLMAGEVAIEAVRVYADIVTLNGGSSGSDGELGQARVRADNNAFMAAKADILDTLGVSSAESGSGRVTLRAGVEVQSGADLSLGSDWTFGGTATNPNRDRPGGDAGFLTLRAAGNLQLGGSLTDGFTASGALNGNARSWSYRLVAGADTGAANPLAVQDLSTSASESGSLLLDAGRLVRTGAGSIEIAAGRDILFGGDSEGAAPGLVYVAGRQNPDAAAVLASLYRNQLVTPTFTAQGGRLELTAARDIVAPEATQLIGNWFWRSGAPSPVPAEAGLYSANSQLAWWTEFSAFQQTLGSFGGGNLAVTAGRDIVNLQAMVPTTAWTDNRVAASAKLTVVNGGDATISAGRDVLGGQFFVGRGEGRIEAGGAIGAAPANLQFAAPALALMDGRWRLAARDGLTTGGAFNPTAVPTWTGQNRPGASGHFYTWGADAGVALVANTGDVRLQVGPTDSQVAAYGLDDGIEASTTAFQVMAPTLTATAPGGDIRLLSGDSQPAAVLFPAAGGQLQLWSGGSIQLNSARLAMAGNLVADWPLVSAPAERNQNPIVASLIPNTLNDLLPLTSLHAGDSAPARLHAEASLEIVGSAGSAAALLLPKPAQLYAGQDIADLSLRAQNLSATDVTMITAGRNHVAGSFGSVEIAGPGALEIRVGRGIDLGASAGVRTTGNLRNAALPAQGASIRLAAATAGTLDIAQFEAAYLAPTSALGSERSQTYRDLLRANVRAALQAPNLTYDEAWVLFQGFPTDAQAAFGREVLAAEFGARYLAGPAPTTEQMTEALRVAFEKNKSDVLSAGNAALAAGQPLTLPGREELQGAALATYLSELGSLAFSSLDLTSTVDARVKSLEQVQTGWRDTVAGSLGGTAAGLEARALQSPQDPVALSWRAALADFSGRTFLAYRDQVLTTEIASTGANASLFGRSSLPMRLALFDQGFQVAELAAAGSFVEQPAWLGTKPVFRYTGSLEMTQSSVITERGGDISLLNPGGAINVGLKDTAGSTSTPKGVIALGGGNIFGYAKGDFQVNTQRVFIVGQGDMNIWSSSGDIDSGRGANTAVAAPPLSARRSTDGVVFEVPATTTGSGLGILEDASGRRSGTIGLFPAFGEILALDAFIRAPAVVLGSTVKGADNLQAASVGGAAAAISAPPISVAPPPASNDNRPNTATPGPQNQESRPRNSLLTVELLGLGLSPEDELCSDEDERAKKCRRPPPK